MANVKSGAAATKKYTCSRCKKTMSELKFYKHRDGSKDEMCKDCLCAHVNNFEPNTFTWILERLDYPYIPAEWNILRDRKFQEDPRGGTGGSAVMGKYLAKMKLKQFTNKATGQQYGWADSEMLIQERYAEPELTEEEKAAQEAQKEELKRAFEEGTISEAEYKTLASTEEQKENIDLMPDFNLPGAVVVDGGFQDDIYMSEDELPDPAKDLTDEDKIYLAMKWGRLYKPNEWVALEQKYTEMMDSFDIQDADTRNTLILMCKTDLKMNQAIDCGDVDGYQKLARVSDGLRKSGKFTAAQNKDKDNEQISCVGQIVAFCEREEGFIPKFVPEDSIPQDIIDVIIQDNQKYLYNLVTKDLGFGQQIENYLKKIQLEHEAAEGDYGVEEDEIQDEDIAKYYERIEDEKAIDSEITQESNAYEKAGDSNGTS